MPVIGKKKQVSIWMLITVLGLVMVFVAACGAEPVEEPTPVEEAAEPTPVEEATEEEAEEPVVEEEEGEVIAEEVAEADEESVMPEDCTPEGEVNRGGELVFARYQEPLSWDPAIPGDNGSIWAIEQVFSGLTRADETGAGIDPDLAESWDISEDGLVYTFHLRDAKFSNGDTVTAEDVVFSLERARGPQSGYAFVYAPVETMEAVDEKTVRITLSEPYAPFLSAVSLFTGATVPKDVFEADPDGFSENPVGSGPFMVEEYTRGDRVVLVPNPHYWELGVDCEPLPYLDQITMLYIPESNSRVLGLQNGDFDVISGVPYNQGAALQAEEDIFLEVAPIYRLDYIYLNHSAPPLDSKEFRLALNYAADREAILETVFFGYGELPNGYWPKMNFHDPDVPTIPYDPDQARELLDEAGYDGETLELQLPSGDAPSKQIATILQQNWNEVGINVELIELDSGTEWENVSSGNYMADVGYITSDLNDDDELATLQGDYKAPGDFNSFFSWYESDEASELLANARRTADPSERAQHYSQVQELVYWDGYSVPLNYTPAVNAHWNYVQNWNNLTTGWWWLKDVWLDQ